ncbi:hypothetical protein [Bradyrhizobium sp.]|jgi:hypothetical protein|nr:hypothetical protein [Bradyrhizobium sp.]
MLQRVLLAALIVGFGFAHLFAVYRLNAVQQAANPTSVAIAVNGD